MSEYVNKLLENSNKSHLTLKYSREHITMRRVEVLRLQAMGESESSIARTLGVSQAVISLDVQFLREQARNKIAEHLGNLAYELDKVLTGLDLLLQKTWSWTNNCDFMAQTPVKDRTMIISLISNLYNMKWQLLTDKDPNAIHHATNYVRNAKEELEK
jgi:hypothetical protein